MSATLFIPSLHWLSQTIWTRGGRKMMRKLKLQATLEGDGEAGGFRSGSMNLDNSLLYGKLTQAWRGISVEWESICGLCPHHPLRRCEARGMVCDEVLEVAGMPEYDWKVLSSGAIRERRPYRPSDDSAIDEVEVRVHGTSKLSTEVGGALPPGACPDARILDPCPFGCNKGATEDQLMGGLENDGTGVYVPKRQWRCHRCGCRVRAWMLPSGHYAADQCQLCVGWKLQRWGPPEPTRWGMNFAHFRSIPPKKIRFKCFGDFMAADQAGDRLKAVWLDNGRCDRLYQVMVWSLVGFMDDKGLRRPSARELARRLPRFGVTSRSLARDVKFLEPYLTNAQQALNKGKIVLPNDPEFD
jgi:hypothetical protein